MSLKNKEIRRSVSLTESEVKKVKKLGAPIGIFKFAPMAAKIIRDFLKGGTK